MEVDASRAADVFGENVTHLGRPYETGKNLPKWHGKVFFRNGMVGVWSPDPKSKWRCLRGGYEWLASSYTLV